MAKKRATKAGKAKGGDGDAAAGSSASSAPAKAAYIPVKIPKQVENWVTIDFKLINWTFSNFTVRYPVSTKVSTLVQKLVEKHGQIHEVSFFKTQMAEENLVEDHNMTLYEVGFTGAPLDNPEEQKHAMYYDFKQTAQHNPLLLVTPREFEESVLLSM